MKKTIILSVIGGIVLGGAIVFLGRPSRQAPPTVPVNIPNSEMLASQSGRAIETKKVNYFEGVSGYLARPENAAGLPGIILIHEFWGLNSNMKTMADELARKGYVALAVDIFEGQVTDNPEQAAHFVSLVNPDRAVANMRAAVKYLRENEASPRIASLGWCFGGGQSLRLAFSGEQMDATVIYYGRVTDDKNELAKIKWPVLGIFAGNDMSNSTDSVRAFERSLNDLGIANEIHIYPGVSHAFANPTGPNYAPAETESAWEKTLMFLERYVKSPQPAVAPQINQPPAVGPAPNVGGDDRRNGGGPFSTPTDRRRGADKPED